MTPFIKKLKFTPVAFALAAAFAGSASAAVEGWYANISGGGSYIPNYFSKISTSNNIGWNAGAEVGYKSGPIRYALEGRYIRANMNTIQGVRLRDFALNGNTQVMAGLANIYYDFDNVATNFTPFVGIGAGVANVKNTFEGPTGFGSFNSNTTRFAYKATVGANIDITESLALTLAYNYLGAAKGNSKGENMFQSHSANVGLTFKFDA